MQFVTILAGASFRPATAKEALKNYSKSDELSLVREPDNQWDTNAVKIILVGSDGEEHHIGYVAKADNPMLAAILDQKPDAVAEGHLPEVERCEILDFVSGPLKPTIVIEVSTGYELATFVDFDDEEDEEV